MLFSELAAVSKDLLKTKSASYYSEKLRLRPNYLVYVLDAELDEKKKSYILNHEVPWAEYEQLSTHEALLLFLKSLEGGLYMPSFDDKISQKKAKLCLFLLDPHLIDEFEDLVSKNRLGVLIRRPILASFNFQEIINLSDL